MKRFGLRALASTLATLMVVSAFGPAKAASAADVILIAPNPNALKTLYITEDMVDEDGEIVISGGSYDRVVVAKEVAAKDIYFDQVTVGEMVVESGGESRIQLWEVDAEQVTVQEPELEALSLVDIKDLLKDDETRAVALQMYKESKEKDAKTKKTAPKIVTKEDAQVETLVVRANVTLDLADGEVNEVALEGSEKVDRAKVTLKNYNGDVSFKGTEGKSNMTLNNVDSRIKTLKVEESNANNYFAVNARNSVVLKAEVAGNARFALNALTGSLEVTEEADAANITLLNTIEEMNIAGDNAVIDVAPCGRVETAAITGDKANVSGSGALVAVEITGEGAYVSTFGTDVEGENTYVPPVYVEPIEDITYNFTSLSPQGWNNKRLESTDGVKYSMDPKWGGEVFYVLPKAIDAAMYEEVIIKVKVESDSPDALRVKLTAEGADLDEWKNPVPFFTKEIASGSGEVEVTLPLDIYAGMMIDQVRFQSTEKGTVATFYSVTFKVREDGPVAPIVPPSDGTQCNPNQWEVVLYTGVDFRKYAGTTVKINAEATRRGGSVGPKAQRQFNDSSWTEIEKDSYIEIGTDWTDFGAATFVVPESWAKEPNPVYYGIRTVPDEDYSRCLIYHKGFSVEVLEGEAPEPDPKPEGPTVPGEETLPELPAGSVVFDFDDLEVENNWGGTVSTEEGVLEVAFGEKNNEVRYSLPEDFAVANYKEVRLIAKTPGVETADQIAFKIYAEDAATDQWGNPATLDAAYGIASTSPTEAVINLAEAEYQDKVINRFGIMANNDACSATVYMIAFVPKDTPAGGEGDSTPEIKLEIIGLVENNLIAGGKDGYIDIHVPEEADKAKVSATSSDNEVATTEIVISSYGLGIEVTLLKAGDVTITLLYDGKEQDSLKITIAEELKEFYLLTDGSFNVTAKAQDWGGTAAPLASIPLNWWEDEGAIGNNFVAALPDELKNDEAKAQKFTNLTGIIEMVDYFEVSVVLTEGTALHPENSWEPQGQIQVQTTSGEATWDTDRMSKEQNSTLYIGLGEPSEDAPKTGSGRFYTQYFTDSFTVSDDVTMNWIQLQFIDAEAETDLVGTYSVKVVLR